MRFKRRRFLSKNPNHLKRSPSTSKTKKIFFTIVVFLLLFFVPYLVFPSRKKNFSEEEVKMRIPHQDKGKFDVKKIIDTIESALEENDEKKLKKIFKEEGLFEELEKSKSHSKKRNQVHLKESAVKAFQKKENELLENKSDENNEIIAELDEHDENNVIQMNLNEELYPTDLTDIQNEKDDDEKIEEDEEEIILINESDPIMGPVRLLSTPYFCPTSYNFCEEKIPAAEKHLIPDNFSELRKSYPHITFDTMDNLEFLISFRNDEVQSVRDYTVKLCQRRVDNIAKDKGIYKGVKVYWDGSKDGLSYHESFDKFYDHLEKHECSVPCEHTTEFSEADVIFTYNFRNSIFRIEDIFRKKKINQKIALMYGETFLDRNFPLSSVDAALDEVKGIDYLVHFAPFSDIPWQYTVDYFHYPNVKKKEEAWEFFLDEFRKIFADKSKDVLAVSFISKCKAAKYRTEYLKEVENYINFLNVGKCAEFKNVRTGAHRAGAVKKMNEKKEVSKKYKFIFAFENSMRYNYATEKLPDAFYATYAIPVYFGAPNVFDVVVPKSLRKFKMFINANDYPNPMDLVKHLQYLNENDEAYMEYFQWRKEIMYLKRSRTMKPGMLKSLDGDNTNLLCLLCKHVYYGGDICKRVLTLPKQKQN